MSQTKVGVATLLLTALAIVFTIVVLPRLEIGARVRFSVTFGELGGLHEGAPVVISGQPVGRIESIAVDSGSDGKALVRVAVHADAARRIYRNSDFFVSSAGVFSQRYLEVANMVVGDQPIATGDRVTGRDPPTVDRVWYRAMANMNTARAFFDETTPSLDGLRSELAKLGANWQALGGAGPALELWQAARNLQGQLATLQLSADSEDPLRTWARVRELLAMTQAAVGELRQHAQRLGADGAVLAGKARVIEAQLAAVAAQADAVAAQLEPILAQVRWLAGVFNRKDGSLLKVMHDPEFPEDTKELGKILKRTPWRVINKPGDQP